MLVTKTKMVGYEKKLIMSHKSQSLFAFGPKNGMDNWTLDVASNITSAIATAM